MRLGLGLGLTLPRRIAGFGPGAPPDSFGALGDYYYDTTADRWYLKRWVANREGDGDGILFPINLFPSVGDFSFEALLRSSLTQRVNLADSKPTASRNVGIAIGANYAITTTLRNSSGAVQYSTTSTTTTWVDGWVPVKVTRISGAVEISVNGTVVGSIASTPAWSPSLVEASTGILAQLDFSAGPLKACNIKYTCPGGSIIATLNEGSGTVITNQAGANGTLTDGTPANFWYQSWVPTDLLGTEANFSSPTNSALFVNLFN